MNLSDHSGQKTGYLHSDFRIFYLTNAEQRDFESHYHDFHKLLLFESGSLSYYIEGETYQLLPNDIVLVPAGEVHRPVIHDASPYRRLIVYISPAFFETYQAKGVDLFYCFSSCARRSSHVLRLNNFCESRLYPQFQELIHTVAPDAVHSYAIPKEMCISASSVTDSSNVYSSSGNLTLSLPSAANSDLQHERKTLSTYAVTELYQRSLLLQLLILLSCASDEADMTFPSASGSNPQILHALSYINEHLCEDLNVDRIAEACFLNRSYLMHLFRRETGYTIGSYIAEKRLFAARTMIQSGVSVTEAAMRSGFPSYSAFYRAYQKKFKEPPRNSRRP